MFGLPGILIVLAQGGIPLSPQPPNEGGFGSLCRGEWMHADSQGSYRGVEVEENGHGKCCALADGHAFVCEMWPGHQHEAVVMNHLRFYDGATVRPRLDLVVHAAPNPGMRPNPNPPPPYASLRLTITEDGFELLPRGKTSCERPSGPAKEVCANAGRWVLVNGTARRR